MSIAKKTKEMWREINACVQKHLHTVEATLNGDPTDEKAAFSAYSMMVAGLIGTEQFIEVFRPGGSDLVWFLKRTLKELDDLARRVRRPILRYANENSAMVGCAPQIDGGQKPVFYYNLAVETLSKIKSQTIVDIKGLPTKLEQLENDFKRFAAIPAAVGAIEVKVGPIVTSDPFGPNVGELAFAKLIEQFPSFHVLVQAYAVSKMAIELYYFVLPYLNHHLSASLDHFALAEYIRIYAYEISKQIEMEYYGIG